jgi:hypothetical protein
MWLVTMTKGDPRQQLSLVNFKLAFVFFRLLDAASTYNNHLRAAVLSPLLAWLAKTLPLVRLPDILCLSSSSLGDTLPAHNSGVRHIQS